MKHLCEIIVFLLLAFLGVFVLSRREETYLADYMKYQYCRCPIEPQIPGQ